MKFLLITTLLMSSAFADHHEEKGKTLEEIKARISTNVNQRIEGLQTHLACIQGAATKEALKACQETHRASMKKLHQESKAERKEWKDKKGEGKKK